MEASIIWSKRWDSEDGPSSGMGMSDKGSVICEDGDWLLEPAPEVLGGGEERCPMADSADILDSDGGFIHVGVGGRANPTRRLARLSR